MEESKLDLLTAIKWQLTELYHQEVSDNTISDFTSTNYINMRVILQKAMFFSGETVPTLVLFPLHFGLFDGAECTAD